MALENDYLKAHKFVVEKLANGTYKVTRNDYLNGTQVGQYTYDFGDIGGGGSDEPVDENIGVYQKLHPTTYLTDTSVQNVPLDLTNNYGLKQAFMNCSSLTSVNLNSDVTAPEYGALDNSYAFKGCTALTSVNLGSIKLGYYIVSEDPAHMNDPILVTPSFLGMFDGCTNLTSISGDIYFTDISPALLINMFRGCSNLNCSNLNIYNGYTDSENDLFQKYTGGGLEIDGQTYTYSYEALGLTKAQLHQATIYDDLGNVISDFEQLS